MKCECFEKRQKEPRLDARPADQPDPKHRDRGQRGRDRQYSRRSLCSVFGQQALVRCPSSRNSRLARPTPQKAGLSIATNNQEADERQEKSARRLFSFNLT